MSALKEPHRLAQAAPSPRGSAVPLLAENKNTDETSETASTNSKSGSKRRLFGFGRKKDTEKAGKKVEAQSPPKSTLSAQATQTPVTGMRPVSPMNSMPPRPAGSPQGSPRLYSGSASPGQRYRSSSPRLHSPASSMIFERNVQENTVLGELSPAIPSHIQTEDHIPPVLEASSLAITDDHLNPDEVEIVMHSAHLPAAVAVAGGTLGDSLYSPMPDDYVAHHEVDDSASNYGSIDTADIRRLSFISFADVVQAEHAESSRDSMHLMSLSSTTANRSPSPVRSPASSHGMGPSPPTSGAPSMKGMDGVSAKSARAPGSPTGPGTYSPPLGGGELTIETMRQALRKTGSGDLSGVRSQPLSAVSMEEGSADQPPFNK